MTFPTLATNFEHEVLGNEYCSGYTDLFNQWNTGFYCPQTGSSLAVYCCGTPVFKYCCTTKPTGLPMGESGDPGDNASIYASDTPVIIAICCGIIAVVILVIVSSCFFCSCCFVHKKRAHVPGGMYRMEESSTTSFHQVQTLLPQNNSSISENSSANPNQNPLRPIISIQPQQMQTMPIIGSNQPSGHGLSPVVRSNSVGFNPSQHHPHHSSNWVGIGEPQETVFHINSHSIGNSSHPGISSSIPHNNTNTNLVSSGILPPPIRFSSNQNLTSYGSSVSGPILGIGDRSNPREIQKLYEYGPSSSPYTHLNSGGEYLVNHQNQYRPISPYANYNQYFPCSNKINSGYCTSTLPSSLRRSGSGSASVTSGRNGGGPQQPLKSILRNPLNSQNSTGSNYQYGNCSTVENTTPIRSYTPMSVGSGGGGGGRRITTDDFDFGESLLASGSGSDEHSYNSYNFPDYSPNNGNGGSGDGNIHPNYSPGPGPGPAVLHRTFSNPTTEYQNDINRLGNNLDPESLSRLIELDLDSKL